MRSTDHGKTVSEPQAAPTERAFGNVRRLTMNGHSQGRGLANHAATDVLLDLEKVWG